MPTNHISKLPINAVT